MDVARKEKRYITIDAHSYRVKPASKRVVEQLDEIQAEMDNEAGSALKQAELKIKALGVRLEPANPSSPDPVELLNDLFAERELIGVGEIDELIQEVSFGQGPPR